ncbi:hypothetical protein ACUIJQ_03115 [Levilactobacillus hammesii]
MQNFSDGHINTVAHNQSNRRRSEMEAAVTTVLAEVFGLQRGTRLETAGF